MTIARDSGGATFPPFPTRALGDIVPMPYEDAFLIADFLTTKTTFITGEPKAGKSLLVAGIIAALLDRAQREFLGFPIHRHIDRVLYAVTDDGAEEELKARLDVALPGVGDAVRVLVIPEASKDDRWERVLATIEHHRSEMFVLDHVLGSLDSGDDIANSLTAAKIVRSLRLLSRAGVPLVAVTHTPKGGAEGLSVASSVIGGRAGAAGGRGIVTLRESRNRGGRYIQTKINRAREDHDLNVRVHPVCEGSEVPVWSRRAGKETGEEVTRQRDKERVSKLQALADWLIGTQPGLTSFNALAAATIHKDFGLTANDVKRKLKAYVHYSKSDEVWILGPVPK